MNDMRLIKIIVVVVGVALSGCAANYKNDETLTSSFAQEPTEIRKNNWKLMVGTWYGTQPLNNGGTYSWVVRRNIQGQYRVDGEVIEPTGEVKLQVEVGEWGIGGNIYFSVFKGWLYGDEFSASDPTDPINRDVYTILELNENVFKYKHVDSGNTFTVKRVADDFEIPKSL